MNSKFDQNIVVAGDLKAFLSEKSETILIDLLSPDHFAHRHIPGARNACVFQVSFLDELAVAAPDKQVSIISAWKAMSCSQCWKPIFDRTIFSLPKCFPKRLLL